jgi:hypothetical protein
VRLIDADALEFYLVCFDNSDQWDDGISKDDIDAAPTVCCEECRWWKREECDNANSFAYAYGADTSADFGCSHFERRQP